MTLISWDERLYPRFRAERMLDVIRRSRGYDVELFGDTFLAPELAVSWVPSRRCPVCDEELHTVARLSPSQHWLCGSCGRCWALVHGHLHGVDTLTCEGCATRAKAECLSRFGARFPAFTGGGLPDEATGPV